MFSISRGYSILILVWCLINETNWLCFGHLIVKKSHSSAFLEYPQEFSRNPKKQRASSKLTSLAPIRKEELIESSLNFTGRSLGSFECWLAGTGKVGSNLTPFSHVVLAELLHTKQESAELSVRLKGALVNAVKQHPLLRACIKGNGERWETPVGFLLVGADFDPPRWCPMDATAEEIVERVLVEKILASKKDLDAYKTKYFEYELDNSNFDKENGPLWRVSWLRTTETPSSCLVFTFNHAISDQISANQLLHQILIHMGEEKLQEQPILTYKVPPSMEETVGARGMSLGTGSYAIQQMVNGGIPTVVIPQHLEKQAPNLRTFLPEESYLHPKNRQTFCAFREIPENTFSTFVKRCKKEGVTVTAALTAVQLAISASASRGNEANGANSEDVARQYKFLLAVDLRPFDLRPSENEEKKDWSGGTMVIAAGAVDFSVSIKDSFVNAVVNNSPKPSLDAQRRFWDLARQCRDQTLEFIRTEKVHETVVMFDMGWNYVNIRKVMWLEALNPKTLGRLYASGLSNMGLYKHKTDYGQISLKSLNYAVSQKVTGMLYQLSCGTINGNLFCTFQFAEPIVSRIDGEQYASQAIELINKLSLPE